MSPKANVVDPEIVEAIEKVLRTRMGRFGFRSALVRSGLDHMGEPILFIDADYDLVSEPLQLGATLGLTGDLVEALEKVGEYRWPHVKHHFDERQSTTEMS